MFKFSKNRKWSVFRFFRFFSNLVPENIMFSLKVYCFLRIIFRNCCQLASGEIVHLVRPAGTEKCSTTRSFPLRLRSSKRRQTVSCDHFCLQFTAEVSAYKFKIRSLSGLVTTGYCQSWLQIHYRSDSGAFPGDGWDWEFLWDGELRSRLVYKWVSVVNCWPPLSNLRGKKLVDPESKNMFFGLPSVQKACGDHLETIFENIEKVIFSILGLFFLTFPL